MAVVSNMPGRSGGGYTRYVLPEQQQGGGTGSDTGGGNGYVPTSYLREHPDGDPQPTQEQQQQQQQTGSRRRTGSLSSYAGTLSTTGGTQSVRTGTTGSTGGSSGLNIKIPQAVDQSEYIRQMYDQAMAAQEAQLRAAYDQQIADLDYQAGQIPGTYNAAADQAAIQNEINRQNFNNMAANTGLNTGAAGQAALSQANALQRDITAVRQAQADAQAQLELERQKQTAAYQQAIAQAIAENDQQRAQALYQEAIRLDEAARQRAEILAQYRYNVWATRQQNKKKK